jgi:hypothetical protein
MLLLSFMLLLSSMLLRLFMLLFLFFYYVPNDLLLLMRGLYNTYSVDIIRPQIMLFTHAKRSTHLVTYFLCIDIFCHRHLLSPFVTVALWLHHMSICYYRLLRCNARLKSFFHTHLLLFFAHITLFTTTTTTTTTIITLTTSCQKRKGLQRYFCLLLTHTKLLLMHTNANTARQRTATSTVSAITIMLKLILELLLLRSQQNKGFLLYSTSNYY